MNKASPFDPRSILYQQFLMQLHPQARLCWQVGIETGLRVSDILSMKVQDLKPQMNIKERKTGKNRTINISPVLLESLKRNAQGSIYCFPAKDKSKPLHRDTIGAQINSAKKIVGITDFTISMHSARKMYAIRKFEEAGNDYKVVQKDLGHRHEGTTLVYIYGARIAR